MKTSPNPDVLICLGHSHGDCSFVHLSVDDTWNIIRYLLGLLVCTYVLERFLRKKYPSMSFSLAYSFVSLIPVFRMAWLGTDIWLNIPSHLSSYDRLYTPIQGATTLLHWMVSYLMYGFICGAWDADLLSTSTAIHHTIALPLALFAFHPYAHYNTAYFAGVMEWSTIPLCLINVCRKMQIGGVFYYIVRCLFFLWFFMFRIFYLLPVFLQYLTDASVVHRDGQVHNFFVFHYSLLASGLLVLLQFYWGGLLIRKVYTLACEKSE